MSAVRLVVHVRLGWERGLSPLHVNVTRRPPRGRWWERHPGQLERARCKECPEIHCAWCGVVLSLDARPGWPDFDSYPTRDHLIPRGHPLRDHAIVIACSACNGKRAHDQWTPAPCPGTGPLL